MYLLTLNRKEYKTSLLPIFWSEVRTNGASSDLIKYIIMLFKGGGAKDFGGVDKW